MNPKPRFFPAIARYTKGYRVSLLLAFCLLLFELVLSFFSPLVLSVTIDSVLGDQPLNSPWYFTWLVSLCGGISYIKYHPIVMSALIVVMAALSGALSFARPCLTGSAAFHSAEKLRNRYYSHIQRLPFSYHAAASTGDLLQRATSDITTIQSFLSNTLLELLRTIFLMAVGFFVMASLNLPLTIVSFVLAPVIVAVSLWFVKKIDKIAETFEEQESRVYTVMQENLTGARVVRAFGREKFELDKLTGENETLRKHHIRLNQELIFLWFSLDLLSGLQIALITVVGVLFTVRGAITLGQYTAFLSYVAIFLTPIQNFGRVLGAVSRAKIAVQRLETVMNEPEEEAVEDGETPPLSGDIVFDHVSFSYGQEPVLRDLSMTIRSGETAAILGGTGSGKTTLAFLLQRLYDPSGGTITIGGTDLANIQKRHLRSQIGLMMQEPYLYSKTIRENISVKNPHASQTAVDGAAELACIHDDILEFPDGYDTVVGERGVTLSGGQKQRMSIARSILETGDILIFDDSLSAVDTRTDRQIRQALRRRQGRATTILISHRVATLSEADRIFVLKGGTIVEQGSHAELLQLPNGIYRRVYDIQTGTAQSVPQPQSPARCTHE